MKRTEKEGILFQHIIGTKLRESTEFPITKHPIAFTTIILKGIRWSILSQLCDTENGLSEEDHSKSNLTQ